MALLLIAVGLGIHFAFPARPLPEVWIQFVLAAPLPVLGVALSAGSVKRFRRFSRAGTDERDAEPTSAIVRDGPYARTRNPMFLGLVLIYLGVVVAVNAAWALIGAPVLIIYLHYGGISREEHYLENGSETGTPELHETGPTLGTAGRKQQMRGESS